MSEKVTYKELRSAKVHVDNSVDTSKTYDISADVNIENTTTVSGMDSGEVKQSGNVIANFSYWGENNLNISYMGVESANQCDVLEAVNTFIDNVKTKVGSSEQLTLNL